MIAILLLFYLIVLIYFFFNLKVSENRKPESDGNVSDDEEEYDNLNVEGKIKPNIDEMLKKQAHNRSNFIYFLNF